MIKRPRFLPDNFTLAMIATVIAASFFPCHGQGEVIFNNITHIAVSLLFFLHGAKLSREAVVAGITHWRLHLLVMLCTFALFPLLGLVLKPVLTPLVTPDLYLGILFLCMLPSTVQSSIAFTAAARGNVPAAICSASASNLFGIFLTPVLVGLLTSAQMAGGSPLDSALQIALQLLLPFIAGQIARRWIGGWVERNKALTRLVDQGSILLVVYTAFSEAVGQGLWHDVSWATLAGLMVVNALLLGLVMFISAQAARGGWGSIARTGLRLCSAVLKRAWPAACRWPRFCSQAARWAPWCCR